MDLEKIREFCVLVDYMNFGVAAEHLSMTQSTLSKHIQSLERDVGGPLFHRTTRAIELSERGSAFLSHARKLVAEYTDATDALREYDRKRNRSFKMGIHRNPQSFHIDETLIFFHKQFPESTVSMIEGDEKKLEALFVSGEVNLFTGSEQVAKVHNWNFIPAYSTDFVVMIPEDSKLATLPEISLDKLRNENFIMPPDNSSPYVILMEHFRAADITPHIIYEGDSRGSADFVLAGMGVMLQLQNIAENFLVPGLCLRSLDPPISFHYGVIYRDMLKLSAAERNMVKFLKGIGK